MLSATCRAKGPISVRLPQVVRDLPLPADVPHSLPWPAKQSIQPPLADHPVDRALSTQPSFDLVGFPPE
jgi:hypothetical protein